MSTGSRNEDPCTDRDYDESYGKADLEEVELWARLSNDASERPNADSVRWIDPPIPSDFPVVDETSPSSRDATISPCTTPER